jgi:hypothetical protein
MKDFSQVVVLVSTTHSLDNKYIVSLALDGSFNSEVLMLRYKITLESSLEKYRTF